LSPGARKPSRPVVCCVLTVSVCVVCVFPCTDSNLKLHAELMQKALQVCPFRSAFSLHADSDRGASVCVLQLIYWGAEDLENAYMNVRHSPLARCFLNSRAAPAVLLSHVSCAALCCVVGRVDDLLSARVRLPLIFGDRSYHAGWPWLPLLLVVIASCADPPVDGARVQRPRLPRAGAHAAGTFYDCLNLIAKFDYP
jgi:hypothetical protein